MFEIRPVERIHGGRDMTTMFRSEGGMALVTAMITATVLGILAGATLIYSRSDVLVSDNAKHGSSAIWLAQLGNERAKNFLRTNNGWKTVTGATTLYAAGTTFPGIPAGTYSTEVSPFGGVAGRFQIVSDATGPDGASVSVEEIVQLAGTSISLDAINVQGMGTHTKLDAPGPTGVIPWYIDARDHDRHGQPCGAGNTLCPTAYLSSAIAGTPGTSANDARVDMDNVRKDLVGLANSTSSCNSSGSNCNAEYTAGLYWIQKEGITSTANTCDRGDPPPCYTALNLGDPRLYATQHGANLAPAYGADTPWADMYWGPIVSADNDPDPNYHDALRELTAAEDQKLQNLVIEILQSALNTDVGRRRAITADITTSMSLGTWDDPVVAIICDAQNSQPVAEMRRLSNEPPCNGQSAPNNTQIRNNASFTGTGLLIVPRSLEVDDAIVQWRGIVLVLQGGVFQIKKIGSSALACGMVLGTALLQDEAGNNPKVDLIQGERTSCANAFSTVSHPAAVQTLRGFGVKYSRESIENALAAGLTNIAWREVYDGEQ
jgi:hypothetical protein